MSVVSCIPGSGGRDIPKMSFIIISANIENLLICTLAELEEYRLLRLHLDAASV